MKGRKECGGLSNEYEITVRLSISEIEYTQLPLSYAYEYKPNNVNSMAESYYYMEVHFELIVTVCTLIAQKIIQLNAHKIE